MNFLFRTFIFLGALLVLALFSALVAPYWIDWKQFTKEFETQASRAIGQPVTVGGNADLRLLPLPFISFEDVSVGRNSDGSPLMTVERFALNAELLPFLSGEVRIVDISMRRPRMNLQVEENGTVAWTSRQEALVDPDQTNIEKLSIQNGSINISGLAGERQIALDNIQAEISARSLLGPWRASATADIEGVASNLEISTGSFQEEARSISLKVDVSRQDRPYSLSVSGPLRLEDNVLAWSGGFELTPFSQSRLDELNIALQPLPVVAEGEFMATPDRVDVAEYRLEIGDAADPYVVTGTGRADIAEEVFFRVQADGRQIDLDRIKQAEAELEATPTLESRLAILRSIIERIPVPAANGEIDIVLPAVVAGDTFIRDVKAVVRPYERGWDLRSFKATFPGNTLLEANGRVGLFDDFGFSGDMLLASRQPSGFAAWISGDVSPQIRRLRALGFAAATTISPRQTTFENLELRLDDALLTGKLQRISGSGSKPAIIAEFAGNRVNTEDLRALYSLARGQEGDDLASHDLNIKIGAEKLETVFLNEPVEAESVNAQVQIRDGSVSVEKFDAENLFGAVVTSRGRIEDVLSQPSGNMVLKIVAQNGAGLIEFAERLSGGHPVLAPFLEDKNLSQNMQLDVELDARSSGDGSKGVLLVNGSVNNTELSLRSGFDGTIDNADDASIDMDLSLANASASTILRQLGFDLLPDQLAGDIPESLKMAIAAKGTGTDGFQTTLLATGSGSSLSMQGSAQLRDWQLADVSFDTTFGSTDVMPWVRVLNVSLPLDKAGELPASAKFSVSTQGKNTKVENLSGQVGGNQFAGNLAFVRDEVARPRLEGNLHLSNLEFMTLAEIAFGRYGGINIANDILSPEDLNFGNALYAGYDAKLALGAESASIGDLISGTRAKAEFVVIDGAADINNATFQTLGGTLSGNASLKNNEGTVLATGNFFVTGAETTQLLDGLGIDAIKGGNTQLTATIEGAGRSLAGLVASLSGNGFAKLEGADIAGVDPDNFVAVLRGADVEGFEINPENVRKLVTTEILKSGFAVDQIDLPFTINRGNIRFRNVGYVSGTTRMNGNLEAELLSGNLEADYSIAFAPDKREAVSGAVPQVSVLVSGPLGAPEQQIDTSQLEGYLSLRAFENSQRRIETLEANVIEKQRLLRQIAYNFSRQDYIARKEEEKRLAEEAERKRKEEEARRLAEEAERKRLEEEQRRLEEARRAAEAAEAERQRLEAEERARLEAERRAVEEAARQAAEAEAARIEAERRAAARAAAEDANQLPIIETEELPPLDGGQNNGQGDVAPNLRESILRNLEEFLNTQ